MATYFVLLRGVNVGGKNKIPMAALRERLGDLGFSKVSTYIASGNVILESDKPSDAIFLMGIDPAQAMSAFRPREGVDQVWPGHGVIYSERLSAQRTRSRLSRIVGTPEYKSMTIRSWATTTKLLEMA